jgi:hypothetical protein
LRDDFWNSTTRSQELGGGCLPKTQSHKMRERIWTVDPEEIWTIDLVSMDSQFGYWKKGNTRFFAIPRREIMKWGETISRKMRTRDTTTMKSEGSGFGKEMQATLLTMRSTKSRRLSIPMVSGTCTSRNKEEQCNKFYL